MAFRSPKRPSGQRLSSSGRGTTARLRALGMPNLSARRRRLSGVQPNPLGNVLNFVATSGFEEVDMTWTNPVHEEYAGCMIRRNLGSVPPATPVDGTLVADLDKPIQIFTDVGLVNGQEYAYTAFAHSDIPEFASGVSDTATPADIPPNDVGAFLATAGSFQIELTWTNPTFNYEGVMIRRALGAVPPATEVDGDLVIDADDPATSHTDPGLTNGQQYSYSAFAHNSSPTYAPGVNSSATPVEVAPDDVDDFLATAGVEENILTWLNPTVNYEGVMLRFNLGATPPATEVDGTLVSDEDAPAVTFTHIGLIEDQEYAYTAFAHSATPLYADGVSDNATPDAPSANINDPNTKMAAPTIFPRAISIDTNGDLISLDAFDDEVYTHDQRTDAILNTFATQGGATQGMTLDASDNCIASDVVLSEISIHDGLTASITSTFSTAAFETQPYGLGFRDTNLISVGNQSEQYFRHAGVTDVIDNSFALPGPTPNGVTWDGENVISVDGTPNEYYKHDGETASIQSSFVSYDNGASGVYWHFAEDDMYGTEQVANELIHFNGFSPFGATGPFMASNTTIESIPAPNGLGVDREWNFVQIQQTFIQHNVGQSTDVQSSFATPGTFPLSIYYDFITEGILTCDPITQLNYFHAGITSTINSTFDTTWETQITGQTVDHNGDLWDAGGPTLAFWHHDGLTDSILSSIAAPLGLAPSGITHDDSNNMLSSDSSTYYQHVGYTTTITTTFSAGYSAPTGAVFADGDLFGLSTTAVLIHRHDGFSEYKPTMSIGTTIATPDSLTRDVLETKDTRELWCIGADTMGIFKMLDQTAVVESSFASPGPGGSGLGVDDDNNLISCDFLSFVTYFHVGFSTTIDSTWSNAVGNGFGGGANGVTWDGTNLILGDSGNNTVYLTAGRTDTIIDSFAGAGANAVTGSGYKAPNVLTSELLTVGPTFEYSGFSATVLNSFANVAAIQGMSWNGTDLLENHVSTIYKHDGFSKFIPSGNQLANSVWAGASGSVGGADWIPPTSWNNSFWPPDEAIALPNISGNGDLGIEFEVDNNRGYIAIDVDISNFIGERFNVSIFVDEVIDGGAYANISGGNVTVISGFPTISPGFSGRVDAVYEITGPTMGVRFGGGPTSNNTAQFTLSRPQITFGETLLPYEQT